MDIDDNNADSKKHVRTSARKAEKRAKEDKRAAIDKKRRRKVTNTLAFPKKGSRKSARK